MSQRDPSDVEIEDYCQAWMVNGNDQSAAWREAYPSSKGSAKNVNEKASTMHKSAKVRQRIAELKQITAEIADEVYGVTADRLVSDLLEVKSRALEDSQYGPCVSAIMGASKICGFDTQKIEMELTGEISVSERIAKAKRQARESIRVVN
jgi:hypothetical protein